MKKLKWLMFDADNTLLDFDKASKDALWLAYSEYGVVCDETIYKTYKKVNSSVWKSFEAGEISAVVLRSKRFADLFEATGQSITSPEEFSKSYLNHLVAASEMYSAVVPLLNKLKADYKISLITNGLKEVQRPRLSRLNLTDHFDSIVVSDEIGVAKPEAAFFEHAFTSIPHSFDKNEVLVIGDNIIADVGGANAYGFQSCWIHHNKENTTNHTPHFEIGSINELDSLLY